VDRLILFYSTFWEYNLPVMVDISLIVFTIVLIRGTVLIYTNSSRDKLVNYAVSFIFLTMLAAAGFWFVKVRPPQYYFLSKAFALFPGIGTIRNYITKLCMIIIIGDIVFLIFRRRKTKKAKHTPKLRGTRPQEKGILIGYQDNTVLPAHIRKYASAAKKKIILPWNRLARGTTVFGDMGCGKSRLMLLLEESIRKKYPKIPILIHDPKGDWLKTCYNPETDLIFAPFDERSCGWDIWKDFQLHPELRHLIIASAIDSHTSKNDPYWGISATHLLKDVSRLESLIFAKNALRAKKDQNEDNKTFQSTFDVAMTGFRDIVTVALDGKDGGKVIKEFLNHPGRIFLLNNPTCSEEQHGALALMLAAFFLQAISFEDVADENELRAAAFIDEALTFHLPTAVERAVYSQSRSKGLAVFNAGQRIPDKNQGESGLWARQACHIFGMRVSDMGTREMLSKRTGDIILEEENKSETKGEKNNSTTATKTERKYKVMAPTDFGSLANREFILFHESGIASAKTVNVNINELKIAPLQYKCRDDVADFMEDM